MFRTWEEFNAAIERTPPARAGFPVVILLITTEMIYSDFGLTTSSPSSPWAAAAISNSFVQVVDECISFTDQSCCQHDEALRAKLFANLVGRVVVCAAFDEALHGWAAR